MPDVNWLKRFLMSKKFLGNTLTFFLKYDNIIFNHFILLVVIFA